MNEHAFEPEEIMAYLDGELGASEARSAAAHIATCAECQAIAGELWRISDRLLDFQVEPCPERVGLRILEKASANHQSQIEPQRGEPKATPRVIPGWVWASASILILGVLALLIIPRVWPTLLARKQSAESQPRVYAGGPSTGAQGIARDSNGMLQGSDRALSSFATDGQATLSDQQAKFPPAGTSEAPAAMVVETASITILASNYDQATAAVESLTTQHGGYVQEITTNTQTGAARSINATLRVPQKQLEPFLTDVGKLGHVELETHNHQEITGPYLDLTARLRNARAAELRILGLLRTRTGSLGDVLQAEQELARIRTDIESLDGQRVTMEHEAEYATVFLRFDEEYRRELNLRAFTTGTRIRNAFVAGFQNLEDSLLSVAIFIASYGLPLLFWVALAATLSWFFWRRLQRPRSS